MGGGAYGLGSQDSAFPWAFIREAPISVVDEPAIVFVKQNEFESIVWEITGSNVDARSVGFLELVAIDGVRRCALERPIPRPRAWKAALGALAMRAVLPKDGVVLRQYGVVGKRGNGLSDTLIANKIAALETRTRGHASLPSVHFGSEPDHDINGELELIVAR